ncbi:MAG: hypothetical protein ACYTF6_02025 [Planctomycetota bacterium]|jgi:hypothetical protein
MPSAILTIIILLFALAAIWIVIRQLRVYGRAVLLPRAERRYEPIPDPNPPDPVVRTGGVVAVSVVALIWSGAHFLSAVAWAAAGYPVERTFRFALVATYFCAAALVTAIGALMLLRCERYGRRTLAMGQFLFALAAFMGIAVALLLPRGEDVPSQWFEAAAYAAVCLMLHLVIDTALGAAAQRVGRPAEDEGPAGSQADE